MADELGLDFAPEAFPSQSLTCVACGRRFEWVNAYSNHTGSCRVQKKRMANALGAAKEKYRSKKARRDTNPAQSVLHEPEQLASIIGASDEVRISVSHSCVNHFFLTYIAHTED